MPKTPSCSSPEAAKTVAKIRGLAQHVTCPDARAYLKEVAQGVCSGKISPAKARKKIGL